MRKIPLFVTQEEFAEITEWTLLPEGEFVSRMLRRWPSTLRDRIYGPPVEVVVVPDVMEAVKSWRG